MLDSLLFMFIYQHESELWDQSKFDKIFGLLIKRRITQNLDIFVLKNEKITRGSKHCRRTFLDNESICLFLGKGRYFKVIGIDPNFWGNSIQIR